MSKHLEQDLRALEQELLAMSALVEEMIEKACRALHQRSPDLAREVIETDARVDQQEVHIEDECLKILALHQPVAIDLRRSAAILKINNDLERIADLAVNIAERAGRLDRHREFEIPQSLAHMSDAAIAMVRDALDAFVRLDAAAAQRVCEADDVVDAENAEAIRELYEIMRSQPDLIEPALHCFSASRHIERIADHATNIAEDIIYLVKGDIARHRHQEIPPSDPSNVNTGTG